MSLAIYIGLVLSFALVFIFLFLFSFILEWVSRMLPHSVRPTKHETIIETNHQTESIDVHVHALLRLHCCQFMPSRSQNKYNTFWLWPVRWCLHWMLLAILTFNVNRKRNCTLDTQYRRMKYNNRFEWNDFGFAPNVNVCVCGCGCASVWHLKNAITIEIM